MADRVESGGESGEDSGKEVVVQPGTEDQLPAAADFVQLQRDQIHLRLEENKTACLIIEHAKDSDQRQHDFQCKQLESDEQRNKRALKLIAAFGAFFALLTSFLFFMLFYGNDSQSSLAAALTSDVMKALGGGGLILLAVAAVRRLLRG